MIIRDILKESVIKEVFSQPYNYKVVEQDPMTFKAEFTTEDGRHVEFLAVKIMYWSVEFEVDGKTSVTDKGDQYRIFATIVKIFKQFINDYDPDKVKFSAKKGKIRDSRVRLYDRMIKKVISDSGYNYKRKDIGNSMLYMLYQIE